MWLPRSELSTESRRENQEGSLFGSGGRSGVSSDARTSRVAATVVLATLTLFGFAAAAAPAAEPEAPPPLSKPPRLLHFVEAETPRVAGAAEPAGRRRHPDHRRRRARAGRATSRSRSRRGPEFDAGRRRGGAPVHLRARRSGRQTGAGADHLQLSLRARSRRPRRRRRPPRRRGPRRPRSIAARGRRVAQRRSDAARRCRRVAGEARAARVTDDEGRFAFEALPTGRPP